MEQDFWNELFRRATDPGNYHDQPYENGILNDFFAGLPNDFIQPPLEAGEPIADAHELVGEGEEDESADEGGVECYTRITDSDRLDKHHCLELEWVHQLGIR
jgi:hypothetical protein